MHNKRQIEHFDIKKTAEKTGKGIKKAGQTVGTGVEKGGKKAVGGVKDVGKTVGKGLGSIGGVFKNIGGFFKNIWNFLGYLKWILLSCCCCSCMVAVYFISAPFRMVLSPILGALGSNSSSSQYMGTFGVGR